MALSAFVTPLVLALLTFSTSTKTLTELVSGLEFHLGLGNSSYL